MTRLSSDFVKLLGERIRTLRKDKGYTLETLSAKNRMMLHIFKILSAANETSQWKRSKK
ncbi:hypothetical protein J25TS5_20150 [Paenibacillus faecis]|nr:hypothetical protein J25TS5_20150 [Paenibacillus faecis]